MYLKFKVKCSCGCRYELDSKTTAYSISCPNCLSPLTEDTQSKILSILQTANQVKEPAESSNDILEAHSMSFSFDGDELRDL